MADDKFSNFPGAGNPTVMTPAIPTPGGRSAGTGVPPHGVPSTPQAYGQPAPQPSPLDGLGAAAGLGMPHAHGMSDAPLMYTGLNPLVKAANPLLILGAQLRDLVAHNDVPGLRHHIINEVRQFESQCQGLGIRQEIAHAARYVLCAHLDEMVLNTVWGSNSFWSQQSLLSALHNDTWGGERFFAMLDQLLKNANADPDLMELMLICIELGFKGKYRMSDQGQNHLEQLSIATFEHLRRVRHRESEDLSPHWMGAVSSAARLRRLVPLWVVFSIAGAILITALVGFNFVLDHTSQSTYQALASIAADQAGATTGPKVSQ